MEVRITRTRGLVILALSALGIVLSGYLTYLYYGKVHAAFCAVGSGCDTVRESSYSAILGIPVAVFGIFGYSLIFIFSLISIPGRAKWFFLYFLSLAGFVFSAYLIYIELFVIKAVCIYCVVSAILITGILVTSLLRKPISTGISFPRLLTLSGIIIVVVLFSVVSLQSNGISISSDGTGQAGLAKHLTDIGATMYGSYRCPHCAAQKELFGGAFKYIRYVECDPTGKGANPALCYEKGIEGYPTWEINSNFYPGVRSLGELSKLSGYIISSTSKRKD